MIQSQVGYAELPRLVPTMSAKTATNAMTNELASKVMIV